MIGGLPSISEKWHFAAVFPLLEKCSLSSPQFAGMSRGRVGVPPAAFRVPRNALGHRQKIVRTQTSAGCCAGRTARQAGRPRYPMLAIRFDGHFAICRKSDHTGGANRRTGSKTARTDSMIEDPSEIPSCIGVPPPQRTSPASPCAHSSASNGGRVSDDGSET